MKALRTRIESAEQIIAKAAAEHSSEYIPLSRKLELIQELRDTWTVDEIDRQIIENEADPVYVAKLKMIKEIVIGEQMNN